MLVDDHDPFRLAARRLLEAEACVVVAEAATGEDALAHLGGAPADVILVDVYLPGIDGFATARGIAGVPGAPPVVLISSRPLGDVGADRVAASGACGFVYKAELGRDALRRLVA